MANGLFGSGPQSNILQTVQGSYTAMLNAEKQKGLAMREAMGAFGQAIDPKTIGMNKFKKQFTGADWTKPETFFSASKFISEFDPAGAMSMAQNGMKLQAQLAPKAPKQSSASLQVTEAFGLEAGTPEHRAKMQEIINNKNTVQNKLSPFEQTKALSGFIQDDASYKFAKQRLIKIKDAQNALPQVREGNEKAATLLERTVSESYNADTRAASEIDRLVASRSWGRGMRDWISNGFTGTPSEVTIEEYETMINIADIAMRETINNTVDTNASLYSGLMDADQLENVVSSLRVGDTEGGEEAPSQLPIGEPIAKAEAGTSDGEHVGEDGTTYIVIEGLVYVK